MEDSREKLLAMSEQQFREFIYDHYCEGKARIAEVQDAVAENTAITKANTELTKANIASTAELVEIFKAAKTGASFFTWSGRNLRDLIKFIYPFILLGGTIAAIMHGKWPKWGE